MTSQKILLSSVLLLVLLFSGCSDPLVKITGDSEINFKQSLEKWEELKASEGDSYYYVVSTSSVFDFGSETRISVENGEVVERIYEAFTLDSQSIRDVTESYIENASELNSHTNGAAPLTLDEVYENCKEHLKENPQKNTLYFDTFNIGIISLCGYVPEGCQDDCFTGIRISEFGWL